MRKGVFDYLLKTASTDFASRPYVVRFARDLGVFARMVLSLQADFILVREC
jgi:hypothetical protein